MPLRLINDMNKKRFSDAAIAYFNSTVKYNDVSEEEEKELARKMKEGSEAARERLINSQLEHVVVVACEHYYRQKDRFGSCLVSLEDLCCEGNCGLLRAVEKFDPEQGRWPSYARYWIENYVRKALKEELSDNFSNTNNGKPVPEEKRTPLIPVQSLEEYEAGTEDGPDRELKDKISPTPEEIVLNESFQGFVEWKLKDCIKEFDEKDRMIFCLYFGIDPYDATSVKDIATRFGITQDRVRRIIKNIRGKIVADEEVIELKKTISQ